MATLNSVHPRDVFEYSFFGNTITIYQRDGGEVILGGYVSSEQHRTLSAEINPAQGQGEPTSFLFEAHTVLQNVTAEGTGALYTEAIMNLEGDDIFSIKISDGEQTYSTEATTVDISNKKSVENFLQQIEESWLDLQLSKYGLDGNVSFTRDGGKIILQSLHLRLEEGALGPQVQDKERNFLEGNGPILNSETVTYFSDSENNEQKSTESYIPIEGASLPISNLTIETQTSSESALEAIDYALDYVAAERSNLGAIQNRLTHTIDNLTNIVTNTEESQSKILDADYAKETTELTRTQIIQQAATAMLAQANQSAQTVLELLR